MKSIFCAAFFLLNFVPAVAASDRVALIIGISNYQNSARFSKAANDARAIANKFKVIGFDHVALELEPTYAELREALARFSENAKRAKHAIIYFAGLGMQFGDENFLLPIDAEIRDAVNGNLKQAVKLEALHEAISGARELRLIILDACRDGPLAQLRVERLAINKNRQSASCFAPIEAPDGILIVSAAKLGSAALDGDKARSPFARAILEHIGTPGLDIIEMFARVHETVRFWTNQRQQTVLHGNAAGRGLHIVPYGWR